MSEWLTKDQIDEVIAGLSAADLIEGTANGRKDAQVAGAAFDSAAARLGLSNGTPATEHIRAADFGYMAERLGEAINVDSPKSDSDSQSLDSADSGS
jgi:hypothetical protein